MVDQLTRVDVAWSGPLTCTGTEVVHRRSGFGGPRVTAMRLRKSMECTLPVRVSNHGGHSVRLDRIVLPYMGPGGGAAVRVERLDGQRPLGRPSRQGRIDAVFPVGHTVPSAGRYDFDIHFTFRPGGCTAGLTTMTSGMPTVRVSTLGTTSSLRSATPVGFAPTRDSDCSP
ncbi:MAG: hypothetical protein ACRDPJ_22460 [Nocardioidaceae bacterium]